MNSIIVPDNDVIIEKAKQWLDAQGLSKSLTANEVTTFIEIASAFQLNPFKREIYCVKYKDKISFITGYEVYLKRAERTGRLDGWNWSTSGSVVKKSSDRGFYIDRVNSTLSATVTIWRKDWSHPFTHTISIAEFCGSSPIWLASPEFMLKKTCASQAFRIAFPDELGGMPYTQDEASTFMDGVPEPQDLSRYITEMGLLSATGDPEEWDAMRQTVLDAVARGDEPTAKKTLAALKKRCAAVKIIDVNVAETPQKDELEQLRMRALKGVDICFENAKHRNASIKKHLGGDIESCTDMEKLAAYVRRLELRYQLQSTTELDDVDRKALLDNLSSVPDDIEKLNEFGKDLSTFVGVGK